jgi:hypothetical protein
MGARVKLAIHGSPWDRYDQCKVCGAGAGSPCFDLRRAVAGRFLYLRVQPHTPRALVDTYRGPVTWPNVGKGEI